MKSSFFIAGVGSAIGSLLTYYIMKKSLIFDEEQRKYQQKSKQFQNEASIEVLGSYYGYFSSKMLRTFTLGLFGNEGSVNSKVLKHVCDGKTKCELNINNASMFGDPAKAHSKVFKYYYRCNKWNPIENTLIQGNIIVDEVLENQTVFIDCNKKQNIEKYIQKLSQNQ